MALTSSILAPAGSSTGTQSSRGDLTGTIAAGTSSAEIAMASYQYFAINATGDINIRFGGVGLPAATNSDYRIPSGTTAIYAVSKQNPSFRLFNNGASTVTYWIQPLVAQL